jgi:hypothetical protein
MSELVSRRIQLDDTEDVMEYMYRQGFTDGLPVVPPTEEKVLALLKAAGVDHDLIIGAIPERNRIITAEKLAVNAVMAGCLEAFFPVVITAVKAMCDPAFGLHGPSASTAGAAILVIVNGPVAEQVGMNNGQNLFGPGRRANATIGRAISLAMLNLGGPEFDRSTLGHPGKFTYCIAEDETTAWVPLHVQRGFSPERSTVTVFAAEAPNQVQNHSASKGEEILMTIADRMTALGTFNMLGSCQCALVICQEHYQTLAAQGWDKKQVQQFLYEKARRPLSDLEPCGLVTRTQESGATEITAVPSPEDILLLVAGGEAGRFSAFIPGWSGINSSRAVTQEITGCAGGT